MNSEHNHLCYSCAKASDTSCSAYETITQIIDDNFENIKIYFQVPECEFYLPEK
jgi:hypothetical protein